MSFRLVSLAGLIFIAGASSAFAQSVPGFTISTYARGVSGPIWIDIAPDGTLYAGRDTSFTGTPNPQFITRVEPGGAPVESIGNTPTVDPDPVLFDAAGIVSGVAGSVLTGGVHPSNPPGHITAIRPDNTVVPLWTSNQWMNVAEMKFDHLGRLLFLGPDSRSIWVSAAGEQPTILCTLPVGAVPSYIAVTPDNRIFVASSEGRIRAYASDGALLNDNYATMPGLVSIEFGVGAGFGHHLYAFQRNNGTLYRVKTNGTFEVIGTGFGTNQCMDLAFGPDGRLYVSRFATNSILAVEYEGCACDAANPADFDCNGVVNGGDLGQLLGAWGSSDCVFDLNGDGVVNGADLGLLLGAWGS